MLGDLGLHPFDRVQSRFETRGVAIPEPCRLHISGVRAYVQPVLPSHDFEIWADNVTELARGLVRNVMGEMRPTPIPAGRATEAIDASLHSDPYAASRPNPVLSAVQREPMLRPTALPGD